MKSEDQYELLQRINKIQKNEYVYDTSDEYSEDEYKSKYDKDIHELNDKLDDRINELKKKELVNSHHPHDRYL